MSDLPLEGGLQTPLDNLTVANNLLDPDTRPHAVDMVSENYNNQMVKVADMALKEHPEDAVMYLGELVSVLCTEIVRLRTMVDIINGMITIHGLEIDAMQKKMK